MNNNWPTAPLIRIIRGREYDEPVRDALATRLAEDEYLLATGPRAGNSILRKAPSDQIDDWEEVTAVPTSALKRLQDAFRGVDMVSSLVAAVQDVTSHLPVDKPSALYRAVTRVKDLGGPMVDANSTQDDRLALLLDALASVQGAARKTAPLTMVARICVEWANVEEPYCDALREIAGRAESDPAQIGFVGLAAFAGDIAASLDDGANGGPRNDLLEMGHYALAWAAQAIEEEDK